MTNKTICDRCGKEVETDMLSRLTSGFCICSKSHFDLCNNCRTEFFDWLNEYKTKVSQ